MAVELAAEVQAMRRLEARSVWGLMLIAVGLLFLLQSAGIIPAGIGFVWAALFALGGAVFLYVYLDEPEHNWWAVIPAFTLLGLGAVIGLTDAAPRNGALGGAIFLGAIGLSFAVVYANNRKFWWAIIPAGSLLTLALIAGLDALRWEGGDSLFFVGLGLTFLAVFFAPVPERRQTRWAVIPGIVLLAIGMLVTAAMSNLIAYVGPVLLIALGLWLYLRGSRQRLGG